MGAFENLSDESCSDQRIDRVVDIAVGFGRCITGKPVVGLDVLQSFDVPGRGELKRAVDFSKTGNQVVVHGAGSASHKAIRDHSQVVADVPGTLGFAFSG